MVKRPTIKLYSREDTYKNLKKKKPRKLAISMNNSILSNLNLRERL